jgi:RNA recognition motif-containing protein
VVRDRYTNRSIGYGFVRFSAAMEAEHAIREANGSEVLSKRIKVSYARPASDDIRHCKILLSNIPSSYSDDDCRQLCSQVRQCFAITMPTNLMRLWLLVRENYRMSTRDIEYFLDQYDGLRPV